MNIDELEISSASWLDKKWSSCVNVIVSVLKVVISDYQLSLSQELDYFNLLWAFGLVFFSLIYNVWCSRYLCVDSADFECESWWRASKKLHIERQSEKWVKRAEILWSFLVNILCKYRQLRTGFDNSGLSYKKKNLFFDIRSDYFWVFDGCTSNNSRSIPGLR